MPRHAMNISARLAALTTGNTLPRFRAWRARPQSRGYRVLLLAAASLLPQMAMAHADPAPGGMAIVIAQAESPEQAASLNALFAHLGALGRLQPGAPSVTTAQLQPCLAKTFPGERDCIRQQLAQARRENPAAATTIALLVKSATDEGEVQVTCLGAERIGQRPFNVTLNVPRALGSAAGGEQERQHLLSCLEG